MEALNVENLKALIAALAPGLIILGIRQRFIAAPQPSFQDRALAYAGVSAIYYAVAHPVIGFCENELRLAFWAGDALEYVVLPIIVGLILGFTSANDVIDGALRRFGLAPIHQIPAAWDYAFSRLRGNTFVLVTLTDGSQVAGFFGRQSFASSSDNERDLLIEDVWTVNDTGPWTKPDTAKSILLCGKDIRFVEFIRT